MWYSLQLDFLMKSCLKHLLKSLEKLNHNLFLHLEILVLGKSPRVVQYFYC